jgi:hypothetical protein
MLTQIIIALNWQKECKLKINKLKIPCPQQIECLALLGERMYGEGYTIQTYIRVQMESIV